jgi:hypothetical protein
MGRFQVCAVRLHIGIRAGRFAQESKRVVVLRPASLLRTQPPFNPRHAHEESGAPVEQNHLRLAFELSAVETVLRKLLQEETLTAAGHVALALSRLGTLAKDA